MHFAGNKTESMLHVFKILEIFLWPKYIKQISKNVFLPVCFYVNARKKTLFR